MSIKTEVPEEIESFTDHEQAEKEPNPQSGDLDQPAGAAGGKEPTFGGTLLDWVQGVSTRKTRQKAKIFKDPAKDVTLEDLARIEKSKSKKKKYFLKI